MNIITERTVEIPFVLERLPERGIILDIGCCEATYLNAFKSDARVVYAIDPRPCFSEIPDGVIFENTDTFNYYPSVRFDCITCVSTIEHIGLPYYGQPKVYFGDIVTVRRMYHWLKPSTGMLLLTVPAGRSATYSWFRQYSPTQLRKLLSCYHIDEIIYYAFKNERYVPIREDEVLEYDYHHRVGRAGAVACCVARRQDR
ncbi:MAG: methyltransferase domain-containing protein [Chloroflexi bacterium]|nr:MAG: methyltransferase domain-containing protein [Chloroflexota bacterium]